MDPENLDDLTPDEEQLEEATGMDGEEAHRAGEFEELRLMLSDVLEQVRGLRDDFAGWSMSANAAIIDNGAVITDDAADVDVVIADEPDNPFERDYYIER